MQNTLNVPEEVRGLNWGALFLSWIWGIGNQVWISLLVFVPCIGIAVPFYLLFKGNELAWNGPRQWESPAQFRAVQDAWMKWGIVVFVISLIITALQWGVIVAALMQGGAAGVPSR